MKKIKVPSTGKNMKKIKVPSTGKKHEKMKVPSTGKKHEKIKVSSTQGSKKTGRAQSATEMRTMTATKIVTSTIIRDCDHCVQLPLEEPQSESEEKNDCDCEW